jgi:hypothetical protein
VDRDEDRLGRGRHAEEGEQDPEHEGEELGSSTRRAVLDDR